jgi:regulator of RNase E activity RraA
MSRPSDTPITIATMRERFYTAVVCDALDAVGRLHQSPRIDLRPLTTQGVLVGRAKTTLWADMAHADPQPYELELKAVDSCQPDDVIIAAAGGSMRSGLWGELLSTAARRVGCVGVAVDGAVRDVAKMTAMGFSVWARGTSPYDSKDRNRVIDIDVPVEVGGVRIAPGDLIVADIDGIVVVPREVETEVIRRAWEKVNAENTVRDAIASGLSATAAFKKYGVL